MRSMLSSALLALSLALFSVGIAVSQAFAASCCCAPTKCEKTNNSCPSGKLNCDDGKSCTAITLTQEGETRFYCECISMLKPPGDPGCGG